ncbi:energy transducer TonB [Paracoccus sp. MC1854]|uniref:energy transducer TonB family protein n=1 Tax=Paracoccus sp. MC1854 TaxID=2760306 RepID=UPI00160175CE|nr:energy transducer TonB [Paracoccus sp. MC1854]MBB1490514.1 energy transducer TonB [Paracoccus sp. MC1854]
MSGGRLGNAGAWLAVGALVLSAHVAAAAWAMRQPGQPLPAVPDAILLDLAPPPAGEEAPETDANEETADPPREFTPEPVDPLPPPDFSELVPPEPEFVPPGVEPLTPPDFAEMPPPEPVPEFEPPPVVPLPPPDFASLTPPPEATPAAVPPPPRRPERLMRREERREEPREERRREARRAPEQPPAERSDPRREQSQPSRSGRQGRGAESGARQAPATAAGASRQAQASWEQRAGATVSRHMSRTRIRGKGGTVQATVTVSVAANGATSARLARGTGDPQIDAALARQAARMPGLPPPPTGRSFQFTQPIAIRLR